MSVMAPEVTPSSPTMIFDDIDISTTPPPTADVVENGVTAEDAGPGRDQIRDALLNFDFATLKTFLASSATPSELANIDMASVICERIRKVNRIIANHPSDSFEAQVNEILKELLAFLLHYAVMSLPSGGGDFQELFQHRITASAHHEPLADIDHDALRELVNKAIRGPNSPSYARLLLEVHGDLILNPISVVNFLITQIVEFPGLIGLITQIFYDVDVRQLRLSPSLDAWHIVISLLDYNIANTDSVDALTALVVFIKETNKPAYKKNCKVMISLEDMVRIFSSGSRRDRTSPRVKANQLFVLKQLLSRNVSGKDNWTQADPVAVFDYALGLVECFSVDVTRKTDAIYVLNQIREKHLPSVLSNEQFAKLCGRIKYVDAELIQLAYVRQVLPVSLDKLFGDLTTLSNEEIFRLASIIDDHNLMKCRIVNFNFDHTAEVLERVIPNLVFAEWANLFTLINAYVCAPESIICFCRALSKASSSHATRINWAHALSSLESLTLANLLRDEYRNVHERQKLFAVFSAFQIIVGLYDCPRFNVSCTEQLNMFIRKLTAMLKERKNQFYIWYSTYPRYFHASPPFVQARLLEVFDLKELNIVT